MTAAAPSCHYSRLHSLLQQQLYQASAAAAAAAAAALRPACITSKPPSELNKHVDNAAIIKTDCKRRSLVSAKIFFYLFFSPFSLKIIVQFGRFCLQNTCFNLRCSANSCGCSTFGMIVILTQSKFDLCVFDTNTSLFPVANKGKNVFDLNSA